MSRTDFIEALVDDLECVRPARSISRALAFWTLGASVGVGLLMVATGPLRDGAIAALATSPRYALELLFAALSSLAAVGAGFELGVPGGLRASRLFVPTIGFALGWIGLIAYGIEAPAIDAGTLGARPYCNVQTAVYAGPPLIAALFVVRRRALYARTGAGLLVGFGAAAIPAAWMQLACLYDPMHSLVFHVAPVVFVAVAGGVAARFALPSG